MVGIGWKPSSLAGSAGDPMQKRKNDQFHGVSRTA